MKGISQNLMVLVLAIFVLCLVFTAGCSQSNGTSPAPANATATPGFANVTAAVNHTTVTVAPNLSVKPNLTPALGNLTTNSSVNQTTTNTTVNATGTRAVNTTTSVKPSGKPTEYIEQDSGGSGAGVVTFTPPVSWTGVWNDEGWNITMNLTQTNGSVSGTYLEENAISGNVSGTVSNGGYNLTGTWSEANASGLLELTMAKSQDHFTGWWTIDNETGPWNAVRSPAPAAVSSTSAQPVSWTGVWNDVDWKMTMTLAQTNGSVSGTYLEEDATLGNVSGTVSNGGYTLTGRWSEGAENGPFELTMANSQDHFTGWYMSDNQSADMTKYPWGLSVRSGA